MGNRLFQSAREAVLQAKQAGTEDAIAKAKNALSSAYANTTDAERAQLRDMQNSLDQIQS